MIQLYLHKIVRFPLYVSNSDLHEVSIHTDSDGYYTWSEYTTFGRLISDLNVPVASTDKDNGELIMVLL